MRIREEPNLVKLDGETLQRDTVTLPVKTTYERTVKNLDVKGNQVVSNYYVQPVVRENRETVQIITPPEIRRTLDPIINPVDTQNNQVVRRVAIPGNVVATQNVYTPYVQRENVNVNWVDSPEKVYPEEVVNLPETVTNEVKQMDYTVPGRTIYTQEIQQPMLHTINTQLKFTQSDPVYRTLPTQYTNTENEPTV